ncbi:DEAD/DEAH box helicase family protein, partial [Lactobacillus jensenii]|uniref:DEAD/DEAH box helicase family protein n=1 Tax=Lactobacillus jensenii TaxID=109790 RepID=UPI0028705E27
MDIKQVKNFPLNQQAIAIYIKLTTIQSLSNEINYSKENGLPIEDLENYKIVILADEAHHFTAQTKSQKQKETSWEEV